MAKHPATFSDNILERLDVMVPPGVYLDPFCGVGKIFRLTRADRQFVGVELEREWADMWPAYYPTGEGIPIPGQNMVTVGDSMHQMRVWKMDGVRFDGVVSSPVYGNRMSDHHNPKDDSTRRSYKFDLGRDLTPGNMGEMYFWQPQYRTSAKLAVKRIHQVVRPGGMVFWNVKNFIKTVKGIEKTYDVVGWWRNQFEKKGFKVIGTSDVPTPGMRYGENADIRIDSEKIIVARRVG